MKLGCLGSSEPSVFLLLSFTCYCFTVAHFCTVYKQRQNHFLLIKIYFFDWIASRALVWFLAKDHIFVWKSCIEKNAQINMCGCCCQKWVPALYVVSSPDLLPFWKLKFWALTPLMGRKPPFNEIENVIFEILAIFSFYRADKNFRVRGTLSFLCMYVCINSFT